MAYFSRKGKLGLVYIYYKMKRGYEFLQVCEYGYEEQYVARRINEK